MKRVKERRIFTNKETIVDNPYVDVEYCNSIFRKYIYAKGFEGGKQGDGTMLGVSPDGQYFMLKAYNDKYVMSAGNKEGGRFVPSYEWEGISTYEFDKDFEELKTLKGKDSKFEENIVKIESRLAETFEKTIKDLQKEGFLKEAKSFDLSFTGKSVNIRLNEAKKIYDTAVPFNNLSSYFKNEVLPEMKNALASEKIDIANLDFDNLTVENCVFGTNMDGKVGQVEIEIPILSELSHVPESIRFNSEWWKLVIYTDYSGEKVLHIKNDYWLKPEYISDHYIY